MSERAAILETVVAILREQCPEAGEIGPESDLVADLAIDSAAAMDLVMEVEDRYDLDIPLNELADLRTVGDLVELVARHLEGRQG